MTTKLCSKCNTTKTITEFYKDRTSKDGLHSLCKQCKNALSKIYMQKNKESISKYHKEYREKNKEILNKRSKEYQNKHKQDKEYQNKYKQDKEYYKKYYEKNKQKISERKKSII